MTAAPAQALTLFPELDEPEWPFEPLPHAPYHYIPILQDRPGEMRALQRAQPRVWDRMTPMLVAVGPKDRAKLLTQTQLAAWAKRFAAALGSRPFFIDVMRLDPVQPLANGQAALAYLYDRFRARQVVFVPVVSVDASPAVRQIVRTAAELDHRGAAVRLRLGQAAVPSGTSWFQLLEYVCGDIGVPREAVDVVMDMGWLSPDATLPSDEIGAAIDELAAVGPWRNIVLVATSMPETLASINEGSIGAIPRREWTLWTQIMSANARRRVSFGDYAVQHPRPPAETGPGMRANVRYTADARTVVARGEGLVIQGGGSQYPALCQMIVGLEEFQTGDYSWGDQVIEDCANGGPWSISQHLWRGAGSSHHFRHVTDQLVAMATP